MTRLQELGFTDFTGGLNVRENRSFQIADNESPQMMNMRADNRLGIYTRRGVRRWNTDPVPATTWDPRHGIEHDFSDDTHLVLITSDNTVFAAGNDAVFSDLTIPCNAFPHLASFGSWGDVIYTATGRNVVSIGGSPVRINKDKSVTALLPLDGGTYNDDYTIPLGGVMPAADLVEPHGGYLFCASMRDTVDDKGNPISPADFPSRIRWSHPNSPEDWATLDLLDIEAGGGRITALKSFQDHLLICKTDSLWALYGYDSESWQLVKVSLSVGVPSPTAITRAPFGVFFYSVSGDGAVYLYQGGNPESVSDNIEEILQSLPTDRYVDLWMAWVDDRLFMSVPWIADWDPRGGSSAIDTSLLTFDPRVGNGAWELHRPAKGNVGPIIHRSDSLLERSLVCLFGSDVDACLVQVNAVDGAYDLIDDIVTPLPFPTRYATNWKFAGSPDLRKHWHRPRFVLRNTRENFTLLIEVYRDYNETEARRAFQVTLDGEGGYRWRDLGYDDPAGDGFDWEPTDPEGRGGIWQGRVKGGRLIRGKSFGIARSVQVVFSTAPGAAGQEWGLDAVILKHIDRRFTT